MLSLKSNGRPSIPLLEASALTTSLKHSFGHRIGISSKKLKGDHASDQTFQDK